MGVFGFITGAAKAVGGFVGKVTGLIDEVSTTAEEKLEARNQLASIAAEFELEMAGIQAKIVEEQASVIKAEIASDSWLAKSWRPILMLTFAAVVVYATVAPAFGAPAVDMTGVPDRMWGLLTIGVGGYVGGRTVEKVTPAIADALRSRGE